jgi:hypothetical protein
MATPEEGPKSLKNVVIYKEDADEMDALWGNGISYARRWRAILELIKKERLVERVRGRITRVAELGEEALETARRISRGSGQERPPPPSNPEQPTATDESSP